MKTIDKILLDSITLQAKETTRLRKNFNFHTSYSEPINRMLNAMEPGTYIQPHKHESPDKFEIFLALRGRFAVFTFDDAGNILHYCILDPKQGIYGVEIPERTYHTLISLETGSVAYEIKAGPYTPLTAKDFAPWAPAEGDPEVENFMQSLLNKIDL